MHLRCPNLLTKRMSKTKRLFAISPSPKQTHKYCMYTYTYTCRHLPAPLRHRVCWAEARIKIARMTLTIKLDRNWSSFQLANSAPPLSVTDSAIAPSARMCKSANICLLFQIEKQTGCFCCSICQCKYFKCM